MITDSSRGWLVADAEEPVNGAGHGCAIIQLIGIAVVVLVALWAISGFAWSAGDTIALNYPIWRNGAPHCCPTGSATVRFRWNGSKLILLDPVPDQLP